MSLDRGEAELIDELKIRRVAERYFFCADDHDAVGVSRCFAREGVFRSLTQTEMLLRGREEIEAGFRSFAKWGRTCHAITSMAIDIQGDRASARLFGTSMVTGEARPGDPVLVRGLRYTDRWLLEDGNWCIEERVHEALWQFKSTLIATGLP